jgi:hypothetical protein
MSVVVCAGEGGLPNPDIVRVRHLRPLHAGQWRCLNLAIRTTLAGWKMPKTGYPYKCGGFLR